MMNPFQRLIPFLSCVAVAFLAHSQTAIINVPARNTTSLNGEWNTIVDIGDIGHWRQVWLEKQPLKKTDFFEYSFVNGPVLQVPGDFNSQRCELTYYEGSVWYKKEFTYALPKDKRLFAHFGAVNYTAEVYLNQEKIGSHEGGFTPFQFEITDRVANGPNVLMVRVNNERLHNGVPGRGFDWLNFGGITRDVDLIETPATYIADYAIQLAKSSLSRVQGWVQLNGVQARQRISVQIPELGISYQTTCDENGWAPIDFSADFELWSPERPKRYAVTVVSETDRVTDLIGFRSIEVQGTRVLLNKQPVFLKAVNIHEENPLTGKRAHTVEDARLLLNAAKDLGCNMVRLAHYPHSENMVRLAEEMGLMVWDELPVYQHIQFADSIVPVKMETMLREMVRRDRNRAAVVVWSLSNETYSGTPGRDRALQELTLKCRALDSTRLITHVTNSQGYANHTFTVRDTLYRYSDLIALNEYIGWYIPWQGQPKDTKWAVSFPDKPVFISEFGGEAMVGGPPRPTDQAAYWTEDYQAQIYKDQVAMFATVPNLVGVCPWLLFDYRSPGRMHPVYQRGYNRKGLLSEHGERKKAWFIMNEYFKQR